MLWRFLLLLGLSDWLTSGLVPLNLTLALGLMTVKTAHGGDLVNSYDTSSWPNAQPQELSLAHSKQRTRYPRLK